MGPVAGWLVTASGAAVVLLALRDIFHTLWHPSGRGGFSRRVMAAVWRAGRPRRGRRRVSVLAGPLAMGFVVVTWVALVGLGWTLVYWPHLAGGFVVGPGGGPAGRGGILDALYVSMVTVATLGFGDIVPTDEWLRVAVPVEALLGFALLTAAVTWVLQVYPALTRRRVLAVRLSLLDRTDAVRTLARDDVPVIASVLESLAVDLVQARVDLKQYAETYYFRDGEEAESLAANVATAARLAHAATGSPRADVRFTGRLLATALTDLARLLDEQFLRVGGDLDDVLAAYAADHGHGSGPRHRGADTA